MISERTKIIYFSLVEFELSGGPAVHTLNWMKAFKEIGADVRLICPRPAKKMILDLPVPVRWVPFFGFSPFRLFIFYVWSFMILLLEILRQRPDFLYAREMEGNFLLPFVPRLTGVPLFLDINGPLSSEEDQSSRTNISRLDRLKAVRSAQLHASSGVTFSSEGLRNKVGQDYQLPESKTFFITNYVDTELFKPLVQRKCRIHVRLDPKSIIIGYVGTFQPAHELEILQLALRWLLRQGHKAELVLVGGGNLFEDYKRRWSSSDLADHIRFAGWVSHSQIPIYVNAFDVGAALLKPQKLYAAESFLKLKEYIACGVPAIVNRTNPDLFCDYPSDAVVRVELQAEEIGQAVLRCAEKRRSPGLQSAVQWIETNYNLARAGETVMQFFRGKVKS